MKLHTVFKLNCLALTLIVSGLVFAQDNTSTTNTTTTNTTGTPTTTTSTTPTTSNPTTTTTTTTTPTTINTLTGATMDAKPTTGTPTPAQDEMITNTLKKMISNSPMLSKTGVDIKTEKGVVTLIGTVDSDSEASTLVENAQSIIGVSDVDTSNLKVKESKQPFSDMMITAKIKGLFIREKLFGEKDIAAINTSVETKNGVVYLTGVVDNQAQIDNAIAIIKKSVPGVTRVEYSLKKVTTSAN